MNGEVVSDDLIPASLDKLLGTPDVRGALRTARRLNAATLPSGITDVIADFPNTLTAGASFNNAGARAAWSTGHRPALSDDQRRHCAALTPREGLPERACIDLKVLHRDGARGITHQKRGQLRDLVRLDQLVLRI